VPSRSLSDSRRRVLEILQSQPEATSVAALERITGLHPNTLREHLSGLERQGLVSRRRPRTTGRGRPGWLYTATAPGTGTSEYAGLAAVLAAVIQRTSPQPAEDARTEGAAWGRRLADTHGTPESDDFDSGRRQVADVLDRMGFATEQGATAEEIRLTRCPLLEAAHQQTEVVCSVHLGIAQGLMDSYGHDASGSELVPFAEPGACLMRVLSPGDV
jgi:predicted ArsR family transcriptional regulator